MNRRTAAENQEILGRMGKIDKSSLVPYYYQLQEALKQEIDAGSWLPGDQLPSEAELAQSFGISRTVIRQALDVLEADAQVMRIKGKGTLVVEPKLPYEVATAAGEWQLDQMEHVARISRVVNVRQTVIRAYLGILLELPTDANVFEITVVHSIDGNAVSLSQLYLRTDASPALSAIASLGNFPDLQVDGSEILVQLAKRYGVASARSEITVEATLANKFEIELLNVKLRTPMFLLSSLVSAPNGNPLGFMRTVMRSDYFRFSVQITHTVVSE